MKLLSFCLAFLVAFPVLGHEGPDPLGHWMGRSDRVKEGKLMARLGPDGALYFKPRFIKDKSGESLLFEGPRPSACWPPTSRPSSSRFPGKPSPSRPGSA